jgi:cytochrome c oxidase assembly protein subunit 17
MDSLPQTKPQEEKPKLKPCCACPDTRKARDTCVMERGEEDCRKAIEDHKQCLREHGFEAWIHYII